MNRKHVGWLWGLGLLLLETDVIWAKLLFPWDRLEEAVARYGLMEKMLCEHSACVVTWKRTDIELFDREFCAYKAKTKRVVCRYIYDYF